MLVTGSVLLSGYQSDSVIRWDWIITSRPIEAYKYSLVCRNIFGSSFLMLSMNIKVLVSTFVGPVRLL